MTLRFLLPQKKRRTKMVGGQASLLRCAWSGRAGSNSGIGRKITYNTGQAVQLAALSPEDAEELDNESPLPIFKTKRSCFPTLVRQLTRMGGQIVLLASAPSS